MQNKLFIRNLSFETETNDLSQLFSRFGQVLSARMATHRNTGRSRGFGFVEMCNESSAQDAIERLHKSLFQGRQIFVSLSEPADRRPQLAYNARNW